MIRSIRNYITRKKVEKALGFKLHKWQVDYIFGDGIIVCPNMRGCGKTLAHQLRLLLSYDPRPLHVYPLREFIRFVDCPYGEYKSLRYAQWYADRLYELYNTLLYHNIKMRRLVFDRRRINYGQEERKDSK